MCNAHCALYDIKLSSACFNHEIYLLISVEIVDCWYAGYDWFYDDEDSSDGDVGGKVFNGIYFHFDDDDDDFIDAI